tara:strand:+ start:2419 stop:2958 length:540 start_codon:yes stop_codon:yes gene_type:complete
MIPTYLKINESSPFGTGKKEDKRKTKMGEIVKKIKKVDQSLSRAVALFRQKKGKMPNELDLMKDSAAVPLITQRKRLVKQYQYLKQEVKFAENTYQTIRGDNPVYRAKKSFQGGISGSSPMSMTREYHDTRSAPALSPIRRVGTNSNKQGTLWDPRFNAGDVTVDPKIARYYKRLTGGF